MHAMRPCHAALCLPSLRARCHSSQPSRVLPRCPLQADAYSFAVMMWEMWAMKQVGNEFSGSGLDEWLVN